MYLENVGSLPSSSTIQIHFPKQQHGYCVFQFGDRMHFLNVSRDCKFHATRAFP